MAKLVMPKAKIASPSVKDAQSICISFPASTETTMPSRRSRQQSCPLTESAKRSLASRQSSAVKNITESAADSNDRLYQSKEKVRKMAQNREDAQDDSEKTEASLGV
jgi:hypothetical protein